MARRDRCKPAHPVSTALCRVRRLPHDTPVVKGTLLAKDGAWQRKYVVEYVVYIGFGETPWGSAAHLWAVGTRNLGDFYADGRVYRARRSRIVERRWHTQTAILTARSHFGTEGYVAVAPTDPEGNIVEIPFGPTWGDENEEYYAEIRERRKAEWEKRRQEMKAQGAIVCGPSLNDTPPPPRQEMSAEAILSQFIIQ